MCSQYLVRDAEYMANVCIFVKTQQMVHLSSVYIIICKFNLK